MRDLPFIDGLAKAQGIHCVKEGANLFGKVEEKSVRVFQVGSAYGLQKLLPLSELLKFVKIYLGKVFKVPSQCLKRNSRQLILNKIPKVLIFLHLHNCQLLQ